MNVQELIAKLQEFDAGARVVVPGYEYGVDDLESVSSLALRIGCNSQDWAGKHRAVHTTRENAEVDEVAVLLRGYHYVR